MNRNNKINKLIILLTMILICLIILVIYNYNIKQSNSKQVTQQINKAKELNSYDSKVQQLKMKFQQTNELLVLEGTADINCIYDNSNVLNIQDDKLSFLYKKFKELQIRQIDVNTQYNFGFTYNLSDLQINKNNNKINIILSDSNLNLKYVEENKNKTVLTDEIHILASNFTPQEVNEVMDITKTKVTNSIQSKSNIREQAMNNTKKNIEKFAKDLDIDDVNIEIKMQGIIENNDSDISNIQIK